MINLVMLEWILLIRDCDGETLMFVDKSKMKEWKEYVEYLKIQLRFEQLIPPSYHFWAARPDVQAAEKWIM